MSDRDHDESERQTRKTRIDRRLEALGWKVLPPGATLGRRPEALSEYETANGPADYALTADGRILGVIEAIRLSRGPQIKLVQAERYARGVTDSPFNFDGLRVPFLYSTNGEVIWFHDVRHPLNRSRRVADFHTPNALREMLDRDFEGDCGWLTANPNVQPRLRPYQIEANNAIEQAVTDRKRQMLVAMATGTGKTYTTVNQAYRLMKSGVARRALAAQAVRSFASFEPEPGPKFDKIYEVYSNRFQREDFGEDEKFDPKVLPQRYLLDPQPGHAFVYVCTIQRMAINLFGRGAVFGGEDDTIDDDANHLDIPIHAFDVIIADRCDRRTAGGGG